MWNNPQPAAYNQQQASSGGDPYAEVTWTADQLQRMESEWRRLQRAFAYHPHVTLSPIQGDPPTAYQIDYRIQTLIVNPRTSQLEYVGNATVRVTLPPGFPNDAPSVTPVTPIFHPNVSYEGIYIEGLWHPNETLLGLIRKIGEVLAYRSYDPDYAINPAAMDWLTANHEILPIDQQANLSPTAGGEPLGRICKYGPQSLDAMKQSLLATQSALFGQTAPDRATVRDYGNKTRLALNLFLENDIPDELRAAASELELAARELVDLIPLCEFLRQKRAKVTAIRQTIRQLLGSKENLAAEVNRFTGLVQAEVTPDPMAALKLLPESAKLQNLQLSLPKLINEAQKRIDAIKAGIESLETMAEPPLIPPDSMLGRRLERELTAASGDAALTRREAGEALGEFAPALETARSEAAALEVAARWREYLDMASKARWIEKQIREWGAEGLQAYFIENEGGKYGPFQFEQSVDLGTGDLIVRSLGGKAFEIRDPKTDAIVGGSKTGAVVVALPAPKPAKPELDPETGEPLPPKTFPTRFTVTERCDDLMVLLEFLRRSTIDTIQKFAAYDGAAGSWAGKVCRLLAEPDIRKAMEEELARAARRWRHTIGDLGAIGPLKERLSTYFLIHRCAEVIPPMVQLITDSKFKHRSSRKKVDAIMAKASRDVETGSLIIPPKFSRQYNEELKLQDECATAVKVNTALLKSLVGQIMTRVQNAKLLGKGTVPDLRAVRPLPDALLGLPLADGHIGNMLAPIEELVQVPLGGPPPEVMEQHGGEDASADYASGEYAQGEVATGEYAAEGHDQGGEGYAATEYADHEAGQDYANEHYAEGEQPTESQAYRTGEYTADESSADNAVSESLQPVAPQAMASPSRSGPPPLSSRASAAPAQPVATEVAEQVSETPDYNEHQPEPEAAAAGEWAFHEDSEEHSEYSHEQYQETDLVFGFDTHPEPAPAKPVPPKK